METSGKRRGRKPKTESNADSTTPIARGSGSGSSIHAPQATPVNPPSAPRRRGRKPCVLLFLSILPEEVPEVLAIDSTHFIKEESILLEHPHVICPRQLTSVRGGHHALPGPLPSTPTPSSTHHTSSSSSTTIALTNGGDDDDEDQHQEIPIIQASYHPGPNVHIIANGKDKYRVNHYKPKPNTITNTPNLNPTPPAHVITYGPTREGRVYDVKTFPLELAPGACQMEQHGASPSGL